jgi:hypothetical protein
VPDLVGFPETGNYLLRGDKSEHPKNHFMFNQSAIQGLVSAADLFVRQKWNTTGKMKLNDMSLEWGGLLDVRVDTTSPRWTKPHAYHRIGKSVDIENILVRDTLISGKTFKVADADWLPRFIDFMSKVKYDFVDEKQLIPDTTGKRKNVRYPHFEWKGDQ